MLGKRLKLIDGSTVSMPDTLDNQRVFPQPNPQAPGVGFPLARLVAVLCLGSGAVLDMASGPYQGKDSGEHGLLRTLLDGFVAGDCVLADCYYASYFLIAALQARGVDALFGQHAARRTDFRRGHKLGADDHLVLFLKLRLVVLGQLRRRPDVLRRDWLHVAEHRIDDARYPTDEAGPEEDIEDAAACRLSFAGAGHAYFPRVRT